nr:hypothetical protein [uncultured Roseibium sp.]
MTKEFKLGSFTLRAKSADAEKPDAEQELKIAVEAALEEYEPEPGEAVPSAKDFELREEHPTGAETLLIIFLTSAATAGGAQFGKKTVDAIWELVASRLRNSRTARIDVKDDDHS